MGSGPESIPEKIRFGEDFELDRQRPELRQCGRVLKLERIPMELLLLLLEQKDRIVTREQIIARLWGANVFLDTDNSINGAIRKIRQVLKDDPERPRFIQTVTGKGYRFIAAVSASSAEPTTISAGLTAPREREAQKPAYLRWALLAAIAFVLVAGGIAYLRWTRLRVTPASPPQRLMLAVMPFQNLTGDASQEYFSDGLTEEMITQLGRLDPTHLGVIARTSVMHYKNSPEDVKQIGRELGVEYVLEGGVRREQNRVRVTAQLIQTRDQTHLWAREYDRELNDLLALQGEIAQEIADEIQLALDQRRTTTPAPPAHSPASFQAHDLYLKGLYFWNKRNAQGFRQATEYFLQAIAKDPGYARAYAGLADSYAMTSSYYLAPADEVMPKARAAALRALQLDDSLAEAHTSLAVIAENYDWDWQTAEKEFRRAIQLNSNYATAHQWYAEMLAFQGRFGEALAESERARELDPLSLIIAADNGAIFYFARQYDRAIERFRTVLDLDPRLGRAHLVIGAYVEKRQYKEALAFIKNWQRSDDGPWSWAWEAYIYGRAGQPARARHALEKLKQGIRHPKADAAPLLVQAYVGVGDNDQAIAWLQKAFREHSNALTSLKVDPMYDSLRGDPRFQDLLRRARLAP